MKHLYAAVAALTPMLVAIQTSVFEGRYTRPEELDIKRACSAQIEFEIQKMQRAGRVFSSHEEMVDYLLYHFFDNMKKWSRQELDRRLASHSKPQYKPGFGYESGICAYKRRMQQLDNPNLLGGGSSLKAAPKAAAPAAKLPLARPAKMAPWSPKAMSTDPKQALSPKYAAERADALASCSAPIRQFAAHQGDSIALSNLWMEGTLDDYALSRSADQLRSHVAMLKKRMSAGAQAKAQDLGDLTAVCVYERRVAQLEGSPLLAGAVDGTLTPLSIGGQTPPWKQQGKDARIIASDGKSAMDCVKLVEVSKADAKLSGLGGRVLANGCSGPVEITWCYTDTECSNGRGAMWTVGAGRSWPVSAERPIRWAACHGANTSSFVKGSHGLRYYCSAPAKSHMK